MERAWLQFWIGLASTLAVGGSLLIAVSGPLRHPAVSTEETDTAPFALPDSEPRPEPPAPLEEPPETALEMSWMPPAKGQKPEVLVHVEMSFPGSGGKRTEFPFVWAEYDTFPLSVPGSYTSFGDGVGPNGEGIGSGQSLQASCRPKGEIAISAWAHWDLAGRVSGECRGKIVIFPETMVENETEEMTFGDGLIVKWWITR